ncbi:MAG: PAS domain-containing protein [Candidatus Eisenbacteria bacterium]|uniref:histidine kinase n=1 Tax=Eiseniibacteriota bacterium TaxID=2212470 RepID=A0A938BP30_UNCEI|nr:PAS domain-containing protein [Candidatus Eisenbacteria bacterium]
MAPPLGTGAGERSSAAAAARGGAAPEGVGAGGGLEVPVARDDAATVVLLESLLEHLADGVLAVGRDGRVSYWSDTLGALTGLSAARALDRPVGELLPDFAAAFSGDAAQVAAGRLSAGRGELPLRLAVVRVQGPSGITLGRAAAVTDLRREQEARAAREQQAALTQLGQMMATAAHQLRNPLGACLGFLGLLERDLAGGPSAALLGRVREGLGEMDRRIGELLGYARPRPLEARRFDLAALLRDVAAGAAARFGGGPRFETRLPPRFELRGDADQLRQACENLLVNAAQAAGATGRVRLLLRAARTGGGRTSARILVRNTGARLAPGELPQLFEPFVSRTRGGTGLGLPLARRIVEAHGGRIEALSAGGWTTFVAVLPLDSAPGPEESP